MNKFALLTKMKISVVIPVYNEVSTIRQIISRVLAFEIEKEIIVVDDGSTDGTREALREIQSGNPKVKVLRHDRNRGKGASLRNGFVAAGGDIIIVQDADLEYDPRDYPKLLEPILDGRADVVYGSRFLGGPHRVLFFWHYAGNAFLTLMANMFANLNLSDVETGYKVFRREILEKMHLKADRFGFEVEFTMKAAKRKLRIYEVPISYTGRTYAEGKKITAKDGFAAFFAILWYRFFN